MQACDHSLLRAELYAFQLHPLGGALQEQRNGLTQCKPVTTLSSFHMGGKRCKVDCAGSQSNKYIMYIYTIHIT